jgi:hypothetical protein
MAIRAEKSGDLMSIYGKLNGESDVQTEWSTKRRKLGALYTAAAIVAAAIILGPHMPGWAFVSGAVKSVVAAIW